MVINNTEGVNKLKINDFTCSLMAVTAELMAIIMNINDRTHKTINFKKLKVMDDINRNLIINGILMDF